MERGLNQMMGQSSGYLESLPAPVRARIAHLETLQETADELEEKFEEEVRALEARFKAELAPLLESRRAVVAGEVEAPGAEAAADAADADAPAGVPDFWLIALRTHPALEELITDKDAEVLEHLVDVRADDVVDADGDDAGFALTFVFRENPFFTNAELSVSYSLSEDGGYMQVLGIDGTAINWRSDDKDVTVKKMKRKPKPGSKAKALTKLEPVDSFFRWIGEPPAVPEGGIGGADEGEEEEEEDEEREALREDVERHVAVGEALKAEIVPNAVKWFTGEALAEYEDEEESDEEDGSGDEGDESEEESDEDSEEDEDDDDEDGGDAAPAGKKAGGKKAPADAEAQPQECKQQ
jgi:nucleosome assembly protein 1-like 1